MYTNSESVSIPKNPRTDRPVGYAFVDLSTPSEAERAIAELSGKEILERKVSVQLARTPQPAGEKTEGVPAEDTNGDRARGSGRGRGRGARGRAARGGRTRAVCSRNPHYNGDQVLITNVTGWKGGHRCDRGDHYCGGDSCR